MYVKTTVLNGNLYEGVCMQGRPCGARGLRRHSKRGPIVYKFFFDMIV